MKKAKEINRNITLTFDFIREIVKKPSMLNDIPNDAVIEYIEKDRPLPSSNNRTQPNKYFQVKHHFEAVQDKISPA